VGVRESPYFRTFVPFQILPKDSWSTVERRLLEAKSHLLALRPADAEAVTDLMIAMQLHTFVKQGTLLPDEKYREAYRTCPRWCGTGA
jgi:hypothetical protein